MFPAELAARYKRGDTMRRHLLAGTSLLALLAWDPAARAAVIFDYTGGLVTFTVPTTGTYQILAFGAQGGDSTYAAPFTSGGRGAEIGGDFSLTAGDKLQIAVGGAGSTGRFGGGGGGGSFVAGMAGTGNVPLVIAGGGGGASEYGNGGGALTGRAGGNG